MMTLKAAWQVSWVIVFLVIFFVGAIPLMIGMGPRFTYKWLNVGLDALIIMTGGK